MRKSLLFLLISVFFSANTQAQEISLFGTELEAYVISAPEIVMSGVNRIAVLNFNTLGSDYVKESGVDVGTKLADYMVGNLFKEISGAPNSSKIYVKGFRTNIFQLVDRTQLEKVLAEQNLENSGLIRDDQAVELGRILGVDAIVTGSVSYTSSDSNGREKYSANKYYAKRSVTCEARMKLLSVKTAEILGTHNNQVTKTHKITAEGGCPSTSNLTVPYQLASDASQDLARKLVNYFCPYYAKQTYMMKNIRVKAYRDRAKDANKYVSRGEITSAYKLYKAIYDEDSYNPKVAYNIGVLYEVVGDFDNAFKCYEVAYQLDEDDNKYFKAYKRAQKGNELMASIEDLGIKIETFEYREGGADVLAAKLTTKGTRSKRVKAYENADLDSKVVAQIPGSTTLKIVKEEGQWYQVKLIGGKTGYFYYKDIRLE